MGVTTWHDLQFPGDATDFFARTPLPPFEPEASGYNTGNALWLAELSRLVYRRDVEEDGPAPQPSRTSFLARAGMRQRRFFNSFDTDTQAMLVEPISGPAFAVLVFRGTEQKTRDYLTDLELGTLWLTGNKKGIHEGFAEALNSVWGSISMELSRLACPVFFTGHSLGGALATLAAARRAPKALYTFGSPRVGNAAFAASLAATPVYRVVDDEDIITTVPPEALGFRHAGAEQRLTAPRQNASYLDRLLNPPKFLADHALVNYVDRIAAHHSSPPASPERHRLAQAN